MGLLQQYIDGYNEKINKEDREAFEREPEYYYDDENIWHIGVPCEAPIYHSIILPSGKYNKFHYKVDLIILACTEQLLTAKEQVHYLEYCRAGFFHEVVNENCTPDSKGNVPETYCLYDDSFVCKLDDDENGEDEVYRNECINEDVDAFYKEYGQTKVIQWKKSGDLKQDWSAIQIDKFVERIDEEIKYRKMLLEADEKCGFALSEMVNSRNKKESVSAPVKDIEKIKFHGTQEELATITSILAHDLKLLRGSFWADISKHFRVFDENESVFKDVDPKQLAQKIHHPNMPNRKKAQKIKTTFGKLKGAK